ncbi:disulfide bond formation protein B [Rossellomorea vietnamensis]|uniref:Probable disulfide formation protein n=1 Tax=Rossellomorea vietnamensis TaxID=218284 RepID=A0A5D4NRG5_9BACI|nr:disulfide oxidoreductase [Rossellomorea vietnamensis]TYS15432.1 disulfide bond formation protein B [Rossellomorea vietnamensis]
MDKKIENLLLTAFAAALIAMLGSLYFSEVKQYEPCVLCWYQRIIMYPMAVILGIAAVKKDASIAIYTLVLSGIGILTSLYHYSLQKVDFLYNTAPSCGRVPCTGEYINWLGFITIPFLALTAFIIIFISSILLLKTTRENKK